MPFVRTVLPRKLFRTHIIPPFIAQNMPPVRFVLPEGFSEPLDYPDHDQHPPQHLHLSFLLAEPAFRQSEIDAERLDILIAVKGALP